MLPLAVIVLDTTEPSLIPRLGDFPDWFRAGFLPVVDEVVFWDARGGAGLPSPDAICGAVLTGSSAMVTDREPWSETTGAWLARAIPAGLPVLGVCYGHQLLAQVLGGEVGYNPRGREIGTIEVERTGDAADDPLFGILPPRFLAQSSHCQSVLVPPPGTRVAAGNAHDPHQALTYTPRVFGVQFHPEFRGEVSRGYIEARAEALAAEGLNPVALAASCQDSPESAALLPRFAELCRRLA